MAVLQISQKQLDAHVGAAPMFNPEKPREPQIEGWIAWSAKNRLIQGLAGDQESRDRPENSYDPDDHR